LFSRKSVIIDAPTNRGLKVTVFIVSHQAGRLYRAFSDAGQKFGNPSRPVS